jgi:protein gp37
VADTAIEWADKVWNPTTGCDRVTPGCDNCYALTMAGRLKGMGSAKYQTDGDPQTSGPGFGLTVHPDALEAPLRWRKPRRVFVNSMSDLFHAKVPDRFLAQVFAVMHDAEQHTFQVLTKRHGRMRSLLSSERFHDLVVGELATLRVAEEHYQNPCLRWPLPNLWLGVSVEDQQRADLRIPALLDTPAAVHFLSCEPLLGPVDLDRYLTLAPRLDKGWCSTANRFMDRVDDCKCKSSHGNTYGHRIDWIIAGGESGRKARPVDQLWVRSLRDQAVAARVPFHFKQWGQWAPDGDHPDRSINHSMVLCRSKEEAGRVLDGRTWDEFPLNEVRWPR